VKPLIVDRADGVVTVTLNRPEKKNAINGPMWRELIDVFDEVTDTPSDRVLVITGAGDGFCSGADLSPGNNPDLELQRGCIGSTCREMRVVGRAALRLHDLPQPTIAAVNGVAAGAGLNMALGCDLIIASERARFTEIFSKRGLNVDFGGSWLLPRLVGLHKAKELVFFADIIDAAEAEHIGIVNRIVPADDLATITTERAARRAPRPPVHL